MGEAFEACIRKEVEEPTALPSDNSAHPRRAALNPLQGDLAAIVGALQEGQAALLEIHSLTIKTWSKIRPQVLGNDQMNVIEWGSGFDRMKDQDLLIYSTNDQNLF